MSESELQVNEVARFRLYENDGKVLFWSDYCLTTIQNRYKTFYDYNEPKSRQVKKLSEFFIGMFVERNEPKWRREPVAAITHFDVDFHDPDPSYDSFDQKLLKEYDITLNLNMQPNKPYAKEVGIIY